MSLFVGNISKRVHKDDVTDEFEKFGKCQISFKVSDHNSSSLCLTLVMEVCGPNTSITNTPT